MLLFEVYHCCEREELTLLYFFLNNCTLSTGGCAWGRIYVQRWVVSILANACQQNKGTILLVLTDNRSIVLRVRSYSIYPIRYFFCNNPSENLRCTTLCSEYSLFVLPFHLSSRLLCPRYCAWQVDARNKSVGMTPLHFAIANDQHAAARLLVHSGADVSLADSRGLTPLRLAVEMGDTLTVKLVLAADRPAELDSEDKVRWIL